MVTYRSSGGSAIELQSNRRQSKWNRSYKHRLNILHSPSPFEGFDVPTFTYNVALFPASLVITLRAS